MSSTSLLSSPAVSQVRHFNRFYTKQIGLLQDRMLSSPYSLTEVRVLYEIAHREKSTASALSEELGLDAGYLSRLLAKLEHQGLLRRERSSTDGRQSFLSLSTKGKTVFRPLESRSNQQVAEMLDRLTSTQQKQMLSAMHTIESQLSDARAANTQAPPYLLRTHQPGDMGWVVHRHADLYWREYRYDERFEALVAEIVAKFIQHFDPRRERCWIAEKDGEIVGTAFLVKKSKTICKLRLLLVEPAARGLGIGRRLVAECVRFGREAGYRKMILWTQSELGAARHLYKEAGFHLAGRQKHDSWGRRGLISEVWELKL
ncbi:MAG TPA: helix-turn-helix domain-containing GNAT family N-acetyltransferase [Terriglobales bacterium]|nr:helix-turn-helix domain-containing GNAT family N-acetyltransferase [Terriglobales bacterium]